MAVLVRGDLREGHPTSVKYFSSPSHSPKMISRPELSPSPTYRPQGLNFTTLISSSALVSRAEPSCFVSMHTFAAKSASDSICIQLSEML